MAFDCPVSLLSFHLEQFSCNVSLVTFALFKSAGQLSSRMVLIWVYVMSPCDLNPDYAFLAMIPQSDVVSFSKDHIRRYMISFSLQTSDNKFDLLFEVGTARFLYCQVTISTFVIDKYFVRRYFISILFAH